MLRPHWFVHLIPYPVPTDTLSAVTLIDKAIKLNAIGGTYDNSKPTQFISLLLKLLQIQPEKEILVEYLLVEEYKCVFIVVQSVMPDEVLFRYLRALAAMYIRMTFRAAEVYQLLEPLLNDYRKLRQLSMGSFSYVITVRPPLTHSNSRLFVDIHGRIHRQAPT
jgi:pre-mRNA-splicing factor 38A